MNPASRICFALLLTLLAGASMPPGFRAATAGGRPELAGHSVEVPGKGWIESRSEKGILLVKRIDSTESYHAGMSVQEVSPLANKEAFHRFAELKTKDQPGNPRFKIVRLDVAFGETGGFWTARGRVDFEDSGASNVGKHGALATEGAHLFLVNPQEPGRLITVWFSRRSVAFDEAKFAAEAERFISSFR
jgi:hypothetical protein